MNERTEQQKEAQGARWTQMFFSVFKSPLDQDVIKEDEGTRMTIVFIDELEMNRSDIALIADILSELKSEIAVHFICLRKPLRLKSSGSC